MAARTPSAAALLVLLSLTLVACEGPTGPEGPAGESGPGTRRVFSGTFNDPSVPDSLSVVVDHALPPEAGTVIDPPSATCWISPNGQSWLQNLCAFVESQNRTFLLVLAFGPNGWQYRIVVVY